MGYGSELLAKQLNLGQTFCKLHEAIWVRHSLKERSNSGSFWPFIIQKLSLGERALLLSWEFNTWYQEGGFDTFFFEGDNYQRAHETVRALQTIGMSHAAEYLERAIQLVGIPNPMPPNYEYNSPEPPNATLKELERNFDKVSGEEMVEQKSIEYLRQHPEEFA